MLKEKILRSIFPLEKHELMNKVKDIDIPPLKGRKKTPQIIYYFSEERQREEKICSL